METGLKGDMSENGSEDTREAFAAKADVEGWRCRLCRNDITFEDKEAFFATGLGLGSRCHNRSER